MKHKVIFIAAILSLLTVSCKEIDNSSKTNISDAKANATSNLGEVETQNLVELVYNYYSLKDALTASDANKADIAAKDCITNISTMTKNLSLDSTNKYTSILLPLSNAEIALATLIDIQDPSTEKKRIEFEIISDAIYNLIKTTKLRNLTIYKQYCPMAFNDQGAYWLSNTDEIRNPYFGKKMLECGEVTEIIK